MFNLFKRKKKQKCTDELENKPVTMFDVEEFFKGTLGDDEYYNTLGGDDLPEPSVMTVKM